MAKNIEAFIPKPEDEVKRIQNRAYRLLRGSEIKDKEARREAKKYARRVKLYRKRSGKYNLSKQEKDALIYFTPAEVYNYEKDKEIGDRRANKRSRDFEKVYGGNYSKKYGGDARIKEITARMFKYLTAKQVADILQIEKDVPEEPEWEEFAEVKMPHPSWDQYPSDFRNPAVWRHDEGSFLYVNQEFFWDDGDDSDLDGLLEDGDNGYDHSLRDFWEDIFPAVAGDILYDPGNSGEDFFVYEDEWNNVERLADDYITSRKYIPKR